MAETIIVGVRELRENLSRYLAEVEGGARITVVSHGRVRAELAPPSAKPQRPKPRYGALKGKMWIAEDWEEWPREIREAFEADIFPPDGHDEP